MPLGVRDVLLVIRAKDQASRQIREIGLTLGALEGSGVSLGQKLSTVGTSMIALGTGLAAIGAGGIAFIHSSVSAFDEFDAASRKTLTQVQGFPASLKEIEQVALDVGRAIPVPLQQIQPALFDIFSSIPIHNMTEAKDVLTEMSKAAVAGATDIQTVARSNFEIMNAFGLKTTDLNKLLDVQFNLVKLGIGDYASINDGIGRLAPTAQIAGQSIETMAGSLAFATRIMGPGGTAISAVSRAFEALANPKVVQRLKDMGIAALDATGNFRPFGDVLGELSAKINGLPNAEKVKVITDLFKGAGGTIQARRFLTEAVTQFGNLKDSIDAMSNSAGSLDAAYALMADAPTAKIQALSNAFEEIKYIIGQDVQPVLLGLVSVLQMVLDWFLNLSPGTQDMIAKFLLVASIVAVVMGVFIALGGALLLFIGVLMSMGASLGGAITLMLGVPAVVVLVIGALTELILHWQQVKEAIHNTIQKAKEWFDDLPTWEQALVVFGGAILGTITALLLLSTAFTTLKSVMSAVKIVETLASLGSAIAGFAESAGLIAVLADPLTWIVVAIVAVIAVIGFLIVKFGLWGDIVDFFKGLWRDFLDVLTTSWQIIQQVGTVIVDVFVNTVLPALQSFGATVVEIFNAANNVISTVVMFIVGVLQGFWNFLSAIYGWFAATFGPGLSSIFAALKDFFVTVVGELIQTLVSLWGRFQWFWGAFTVGWSLAINVLQIFIDFLLTVAGTAIQAFIDTFMAAMDILWPTIQAVFDIIVIIFQTAFDTLLTIVQFGIGVIVAFWDNFGGTITSIIKNVWDLIAAIVTTAINLVKDIISIVLNIIQGDWSGAWDAIKQFFIDAWNGIWAALQAVWGLLVNFFVNLPGSILGFVGDLLGLLREKGADLLRGLLSGAMSIWGDIWGWVTQLPGKIAEAVGDLWNTLIDAGKRLMGGLLQGIKDGFGAVKDFLGGIAGSAKGIKGPPSYDAVVLVDNGKLLMQGLQRGLESGYKDVQKFLQSVSPDISGTINVANSMMSQAALGSGPNQVAVMPPTTSNNNITFAAGAFVFPNATDPEGTAEAVKQMLEELLNEMASR